MAHPSPTPKSGPRVPLSVTHLGETLESLEQVFADFRVPHQEWRRLEELTPVTRVGGAAR